jgi:glycosyltransferase involved in cell wall biosynthesis
VQTPTVTIVIPTCNRSRLLREAIQSVLSQTYTDLALLVSDNASSDDTAHVVASFQDARIRYHRHPRNIGMTANFRSAIEMAHTEFVAPLPDDDLFLPDHLQNALEALKAFPRAAYYASPAELFGGDSAGTMRPRAIRDTTTPLLYIAPKQAVDFLGIDTPSPFHAVCRRSAFTSEVYWGQSDFYPFDALVLIQLMTQGGFVFSNRATTRFRIHASSTSGGSNDKVRLLRYNLMVWYGVRWLAQFLLDKQVCTLDDLERHGLQAVSEQHVVPFVLGLGSFDSSTELRALARRVFQARTDMDAYSARFRLARKAGFWTIPISERITQMRCGWRP